MKESEEFLCLPINQLIDIISSDELNMTCEEDVFNAVMQWISYDLQQRKQYLFKVKWFFYLFRRSIRIDLDLRTCTFSINECEISCEYS